MSTVNVLGRTCVTGPDVSMYQPGTNFSAAAAAGEAFAFIKATEGVGYLDPWFGRHTAAVKASGLPWAPYHFARPGNNPTTEADWFVNQIADKGWTLPPVLDMEAPGTGAWVLTFCDRVAQRLGVAPVIYTGAYVAYDRPARLGSFTLWIAAYNAGYSPDPNPAAIGQPPSCAPWGRSWDIWQYTSSANVPGVPGRCDRSVMSYEWLTRMLGQPPTPPPPQEDIVTDDDIKKIAAATAAVAYENNNWIGRDARDGGSMYIFHADAGTKVHIETLDQVDTITGPGGLSLKNRGDMHPHITDSFTTELSDYAPGVLAKLLSERIVTVPQALTDDDLAKIAKAVNDEQVRRLST